MSCNGCRVLRKGCSETCVLRNCLRWIEPQEAQGNATLFLAKFFGRSDLLALISSVPESQRPALFQSLLYEACGRTVNPVNGAVGLLWSGNWHVCQAAVETVLAGGVLRPIFDESPESSGSGADASTESSLYRHSASIPARACRDPPGPGALSRQRVMAGRTACNYVGSLSLEETSEMTSLGSAEEEGEDDRRRKKRMTGGGKVKLLNLFV